MRELRSCLQGQQHICHLGETRIWQFSLNHFFFKGNDYGYICSWNHIHVYVLLLSKVFHIYILTYFSTSRDKTAILLQLLAGLLKITIVAHLWKFMGKSNWLCTWNYPKFSVPHVSGPHVSGPHVSGPNCNGLGLLDPW